MVNFSWQEKCYEDFKLAAKGHALMNSAQAAADAVDAEVNPDMGGLVSVFVGGKEYQLLRGNVVMKDLGGKRVIDTEKSSKDFVIKDMETGQSRPVSASEIEGVGEFVSREAAVRDVASDAVAAKWKVRDKVVALVGEGRFVTGVVSGMTGEGNYHDQSVLYDQRIAEAEKKLQAARTERDKKLAEINNRNGLFGDRAASTSSMFGDNSDLSGKNRQRIMKPLNDLVEKAERDLRALQDGHDAAMARFERDALAQLEIEDTDNSLAGEDENMPFQSESKESGDSRTVKDSGTVKDS